MRHGSISIFAVIILAAAGIVWTQGRGNPNEWPTAYGDAQHSSWLRTDVNISPESMSGPGFELQWKTRLDSQARQGVSLTSGVVTSAVNLFTPVSTVAGPSNQIFALDNDTGNLFWTRRFDGALGPSTAGCPGGISGAPTRMANLIIPPAGAPRGGGGRGGQSYSSAVGEPNAGVPVAPRAAGAGRGAGAAAAGQETAPSPPPARGNIPAAAPAVQALPSPFPTNSQAVAAAGGAGGGLFRSSGVTYAVSADGRLRTLGLVSGKDVQRPAPFLPAGGRFSDLIGVRDMIYTATSQGCGGVPNGIWAINVSGDPKTVVSWKTNGGSPIGSVAFATNGTAIVAIGPGSKAADGYANAIVALDPTTLAMKDWFAQPGIEFATPPIVFEDGGRNIVSVTTTSGRVVLLDASSLGGGNHATPLYVSPALITGRASAAAQSPATWHDANGTRWLVMPTSSSIVALKLTVQNGEFTAQPGWVSDNLDWPLTPIVVNGVVFVASSADDAPAKLLALGGATGKTLWQSRNTMKSPTSGRSFWTGSGHVFVGTRDGTVYAFGFAMERK